MSEAIKVCDKLPEPFEMVLAFLRDGEDGFWVMVLWDGEKWSDDDPHFKLTYNRDAFTHWVSLPPAPR